VAAPVWVEIVPMKRLKDKDNILIIMGTPLGTASARQQN